MPRKLKLNLLSSQDPDSPGLKKRKAELSSAEEEAETGSVGSYSPDAIAAKERLKQAKKNVARQQNVARGQPALYGEK